ncbi:FAD-dependent monooxygenase [Dactylosporangium matsuzakiense]|uniref:FAD-dependent oxidoreductase n=1 Tax=Dactylosporangium matsuzakiense TaxID=53360 RepID=A0A9W6NI53_9ACTN|nr:FAD-dependent monooxygenase [Dactylosporangium matsuzakiense]UWZ47045.1 FAD-dependent monooxygenase [Dactylosporangium matsuzakiense]GLK98524.1 FAD-dependent oxidoreductase [Dactylosporangium matsuzakiense]
MKHTTVLISGAGIAGPALAFWLARYGCDVTVVERAPQLRPGGQAVDFKGATHRTVLERMGLLDAVRERQTGGRDQTIVDEHGRPLAVIPGEFTGGDIEIGRGELAALLHARTAGACEYRFGDSVTSLTETADRVHVTFAGSAPAGFDLVVGADGIHSNIRRLAFGPELDYVTFLGHYYALVDGLTADGGRDDEAFMYNEPGRMVATGGPKAPAFFVFRSPQLQYDRYDPQAAKRILRGAYSGGRWRIPELLDRLDAADDVYLDSISRVQVPAYSKGRVVLLGDAGYGNTLGGFGTGLAVVGAYVLAGELRAAGGDFRTAFAAYETAFRGYAKVSRQGSAGPFLAPPSGLRIAMRNWTFQSRWLLRMMLKLTDRYATGIELKQY